MKFFRSSDEAKVKLADFCLTEYVSDPTRPKLLYEQIRKLSQHLLARDPNSFDGHRLEGYLGIFDRNSEQALEHFARPMRSNRMNRQ